MVFNSLYNTKPFIVHNPFIEIKNLLWEKIKKIKPKVSVPKDLTIITWNNSPTKGLIEKQMDFLGVEYICLGKQKTRWNNRLKPILLLENISKIKTKYILALDCFDTFIVSDLKNILDEFKKKIPRYYLMRLVKYIPTIKPTNI